MSSGSGGLSFLQNKFCQSSQIYLSPEKTDYFKAYKLLGDIMTRTIFPNCQIAFLGKTVIYHSKIEAWQRRHSCNTLDCQ